MNRYVVGALALSVLAGTFASFSGCKSNASVQAAGGGAGAANISGPPTMNAEYGVRNPRTCAKVTSPPDVETAKALVQCNAERLADSALWVVTDLQVQMGSPRAMTINDTDINDLDATSKIYPLKGQGTNWSCGLVSQWGVGTNCQKFLPSPDHPGRCWHTLFGEWKCSMGVGSSNWVTKQPGPTTY
jgi:hypothetical protein